MRKVFLIGPEEQRLADQKAERHRRGGELNFGIFRPVVLEKFWGRFKRNHKGQIQFNVLPSCPRKSVLIGPQTVKEML